jgi:hypothetical protein
MDALALQRPMEPKIFTFWPFRKQFVEVWVNVLKQCPEDSDGSTELTSEQGIGGTVPKSRPHGRYAVFYQNGSVYLFYTFKI